MHQIKKGRQKPGINGSGEGKIYSPVQRFGEIITGKAILWFRQTFFNITTRFHPRKSPTLDSLIQPIPEQLSTELSTESWLNHFLDTQLGLVMIYQPVTEKVNGGTPVIRFETLYCKAGAEKIAPFYQDLVLQEKATWLTEEINEKRTLYDMLLWVCEKGGKFQNRFLHPATGCHYRVVCNQIPQGVLTVAYDITEEVQDRAEMERLAKQLQTVIGTSQSGVHIFKPYFDESGELTDFRILMVNQIIGDYIGQTVESLTGALASTYFPAYKTNGLFEIYRDCYLNGTRHHFDFHYEDGYDVFFNLLVVKLEDEVLVTLTDHTALKRLQRELEASIADLKRSNASLEQFAHASSHDLQEPLRKIIFYTDRLLSEHADKMEDEAFSFLERIRTSSKRMHRLVQDLLVFAEVGGNRPEPEEVDLRKIVNDVLSDLEVAVKERDAVVKVEPLGRIKGDALHLHQLFQNLLSNALKYSHHDKQPVIAVSSETMNGKETGLASSEWEMQQTFCVITIKDNGQGFTDEEAGQIFKIFQRLPQHRYEQSGTGIGLAIVQRVVENHKGYIRAQGVPGEGATFTIYLPVG